MSEGGRDIPLQERKKPYCALITESSLENSFKAYFTYKYMLIPHAENTYFKEVASLIPNLNN